MKENVRLGRIAGIAVGFNWTLLLIAGFLAFTLAGTRFPIDAPNYSHTAYNLAGLFTAVAFLGGVLAHEMSHALVARRHGLKVDGIVLWLMGGYTRISEPPKTPRSELWISAAGPIVSLLIGLGCGVLAVAGHAVGFPRLAVSVLTWLGTINVLLAVFNLLPGSPLDGGRIAHSLVWWRTGDKYKATRVASRAGTYLGAGLVGFGVFSLLSRWTGVDGLWLAIVGGFLMMASRAEGGASAVLESLDGLQVTDLMAHPGVGPGWLTIDAFLREYAGGPLRPPAYLIEQWGGGLAGLAPTVAMEAVPLGHRFEARAGDFALPMAGLPVFPPSETAGEAATVMSERNAPWALVVRDGQIIGVLNLADMAETARKVKATAAGSAVGSSSWSLTSPTSSSLRG
jgi:Zn-dependent protease